LPTTYSPGQVIGNASAVTLDQVLMPKVADAPVMYERDDDRPFCKTLKVQR
jgi:hypothetical protein